MGLGEAENGSMLFQSRELQHFALGAPGELRFISGFALSRLVCVCVCSILNSFGLESSSRK